MIKKIFTVFVVVFGLLGCGKKKSNHLVVGTTLYELITLDPAEIFEFQGSEYACNVYETLISFDPENPSDIRGEVAESWSVSDDRKTITFKIRPGIKFASGNSLTAHDVAFSLHRAIILQKEPSQIIGQFGFKPENVKQKIRVLDDQTLQFEMEKPYAESLVLYALTSVVGCIVDKKEVLKHEVDGDMGHQWLKSHYAGSGPFKLGSWTPNELLVIERNDQYWGDAPLLEKVIFRHVNDSSSQVLMLEKGDLDTGRWLKMDQLKHLKEKIDIVKVPVGHVRYLSLNQKNQYLRIPEVQEAIRYLIDYEGITKTFGAGESFVHQTFVPRGFFGALEENPYTFNPEKAKDILKKVGLENGITLSLETTNAEFAQILQAGFKKGGIEVVINMGDAKQVLTRIRERNYEMGLTLWGSDYFDPHANAQTFARNADNTDASREKTLAWRVAWDIPDLTKQTEAAMLEHDRKKRESMYHDIQRKLMKSPLVNIYQYNKVFAVQKNVKGIVFGKSVNKILYSKAYKE